MARIRLELPSRVERQIKSLVKRMFPREAYGLLLGTAAGDSVAVDELWVPEDLARWSQVDRIEVRPEWRLDAREEALESGLWVVGDVHSHPYRKADTIFDPVQSVRDVELQGDLFIYGVCNVVETKRGLRCELKFWGPQVTVERV